MGNDENKTVIPQESTPGSKPAPRFLKTAEAEKLTLTVIALCDAVIETLKPMDAARLLAARAALLGTREQPELTEEVQDGAPF